MQCADVAELMKDVNSTLQTPIAHLYWYAGTTNTASPIYNIKYSIFKTGKLDMNEYFGILYPIFEGVRDYCAVIKD